MDYMKAFLKNLHPFQIIGVLLVVGSLASTFEIMGVSIDANKWLPALLSGFVLIALGTWRKMANSKPVKK